jgi:hypothetical protein
MNAATLLATRRLRLGERVRFLDPIESHDPRKRRPAGEVGTVTDTYSLDDTEYRIDLDSGGVVLVPSNYLDGVEVIEPAHWREVVSYSPFGPPETRDVPVRDPDEETYR